MRDHPAYDLVLGGGRVIDPGRGVDTMADVAVTGDRIVAIGPNLEVPHAVRRVDVSGKLVVPGLIDVHAHVYQHGTAVGLGPDLAGVLSGVTTVVDAGSAGSATYAGFHHHVIVPARTTVLANVHIARHGLSHVPEARTMDDVDIASTVAVARKYPEVVGVKVRACGPVVDDEGTVIVEAAARAAREAGVKLMVHIGDANFGRADITADLLPMLEPGDMLTHLYTGALGRVIDDNQRVLSGLEEARDRGVILDAAHGRRNLDFDVARRLIDLGVVPFTISTDITKPGWTVAGPMTHNLGRFLALGFSLTEVVLMSTYNPATVLGAAEDLGTLAEGTMADVTVLEPVPGSWLFEDAEGHTIEGELALRPVLTLKAGRTFEPDPGPLPDGWLPTPRTET
jgi:dihydroorotase